MKLTIIKATVRKNSGLIEAGKIVSKNLVPFIGKKIEATIKEVKEVQEK
ncbi:MAG TPA: hypothetical protein VMZ91_07830 [Candidatus Paceibacterota bacterium]|nr:hypothetical protein [Candidatus Paceibacterota bacterium]